MRKIIISFLALFIICTHSIAQNDNPKLQALLDANETYTYLKDFVVELEPESEDLIPVVLSKKTKYAISVYQENKGQFYFELLKSEAQNKENKDLLNAFNEISIKDGSMSMEYTIKETAKYYILIRNKSNKKASTVVLLSFVEKLSKSDLEEEVVIITSKGMSQKEKDFFEGKDTDPKVEAEEIFFIVEEMPKFNGKNADEFKTFIQNELKYPQVAIDQKIEGRIFVQFTVNKDGYIKDAKVVRGIHPALDQEALRIVYSSPRWESGKQRSHAVNVSFTFPVIFELSEKWTIINPQKK